MTHHLDADAAQLDRLLPHLDVEGGEGIPEPEYRLAAPVAEPSELEPVGVY